MIEEFIQEWQNRQEVKTSMRETNLHAAGKNNCAFPCSYINISESFKIMIESFYLCCFNLWFFHVRVQTF